MMDKPILFSSPMVQAILDSRKTMTRRVIKNPEQWMIEWNGIYHSCEDQYGESHDVLDYARYQKGDRLWVRETHHVRSAGSKNGTGKDIVFKADDPDFPYGWTPSIFMPRWASRITLEVTAVKVERLNEISEADVRAEGIIIPNDVIHKIIIREYFIDLWNSINGKTYPWESNPWVFAYSFKQIKED
jgi:hypothetical protein